MSADINRIIVTCRLENGDSIDTSVKAVGRGYNQKDVQKLRGNIEKLFTPYADDILYYNVRTWAGDGGKVRQNWSKLPSLEELDKVLKKVMVMEDEEASD